MSFDLVVRNGRVVDGGKVTKADVGISAGVVRRLGSGLASGTIDVDAAGRYVFPGGVDSHVHMGQLSSQGEPTADDFATGTVAAAHGGTTTVVPFAAQHRSTSITKVFTEALARASSQATIDFGLQMIITDWDDRAAAELEEVAEAGVLSVKLYLTYDRLRLDTDRALDVMGAAHRLGLPVMVHAEDDELVAKGRSDALDAGQTGAEGHIRAHSREAEKTGVATAIGLAEESGATLVLAHLSLPGSVELAAAARSRGVDVVAETCPHYLLLDDSRLKGTMDRAAPFISSPPLRSQTEVAAMLDAVGDGLVDIVTSDHSPYTMDQKLPSGSATIFTDAANGLPGVELRLSLLYSAAVATGRLDVTDFVELVASRPARTFGLYPAKGSLQPGADADLVVWDHVRRGVTTASLHDAVGHTPYAGMELTGWPAVVVARGEIIVSAGINATVAGRGRFLSGRTAGRLSRD